MADDKDFVDDLLNLDKGDYSDPDDPESPFHGEAGGIKTQGEEEPTPTPEPPAPKPEPTPEPEPEPEPEPVAAEPEPATEIPVEEPEPAPAALTAEEWDRQRNALVAERQQAKKELQKVREELAILRSQQGNPITPPAAPGQSPQATQPPGAVAGASQPPQAPDQPPGIPVQVSEDGQHVFVDPAAINAEIERRMAPPPGAEAQAAGIQTFMSTAQPGQEYADAAETVQRVQQVDNWLGQKLIGLMQQGFRPQGPQQVKEVLQSVGAFDELSQTFPEVVKHADALLSASASPDPNFRAMVFRQIHADRMASKAAPEELAPAPPQPNGGAPVPPTPPLADVSQTPQSLARNGGSRSKDSSPKHKEFEALEKEYFSNPMMHPDKYRQYLKLGKDLGKEGFESMGL